MGVESGQHEAMTSVDNHEAVIWIATAATGNFRREDLPELDQSRSVLKRASGGRKWWRYATGMRLCRRITSRWSRALRIFRRCGAGRFWPEIVRDKSLRDGTDSDASYQALGDDGFFLCVKLSVLAHVVSIASQTEGWALHASSSRSSPRSTQRKLLDYQHTYRADTAFRYFTC